MKYIVKNCPATTGTNGFCGDDRPEVFCQDCTNCLIKQVIEKCRNIECPCPNLGVCCFECPTGSERDFASEIMELFEIEEVDNDNRA